MASKAAAKRLAKEFVGMQKEPPPFVWAAPDEKDILTWYFIVRGPPDSPYTGGEYLGVILFPSEYPFRPPGIKMLTPSGRFQPDRKICFSMSDFHPGTWNPAWSVATILTGLLSFMLADEMTTGSITSTDRDKRILAERSHAWNLEHKKFKETFPDYCTPLPKDPPNMAQKERGIPDSAPTNTNATTTPTDPATAAASSTHAVSAPSAPAAVAAIDTTTGSNGASRVATWRRLLSEKWRWGIILCLAVLVSRLSST